MAEKKQITTRIALKNDLSSKWESSNLIALAGEYLFDNERKYIKVGDGTKTWKDLDTIHIPVSAVDGLADVDKDTIYDISADGTKVTLISADSRIKNPTWGEVRSWDISGLIATQVEAEKTRAISAETDLLTTINAVNTALTTERERAEGVEEGLDTRIKAIEDDYLKAADKKELSDAIVAEETRAKGVEKELSDAISSVAGDYATKAEVNAISTLLSTDVEANRDAIAILNGADTVDGSVAKSIKDAIEALDVAELTVGPDETIKSIKEEDGKIVVEKQSIQLSGTDQVTGLDDKLSNNLTALNQEIADRKAADAVLSTDYIQKITAETTRAEGVESGLDTRLTKAEEDIAALETNKANLTALTAEIERAEGAEKGLADRLDVIEGEGEGSVKKALADAKDYANSLCADLSTTADAKFVKYTEVQTPITETNKVATMADVAGLSGVIHFRGITETEFTGEGKPDTAWYKTHDAEAGDIVVDSTNSKEWMYDGAKWLELGDESKYVEKAFELNGHQLTGTTLDLVGSDIKVGGIYADKNVDEALNQLSADAKAYTDAEIEKLDVKEISVGADKTLVAISETDGKIAATAVAIQIAETQVTNLTSDLKTLSDMVEAEADAREESDSAICAIVAAEVGRAKEVESELSTKITNALDDAKAYTDAEIQKLDYTDTAVEHQFVTKVNEVDGKITVTRAALVADDIPELSSRYDVQGAAADALVDAKAYTDEVSVALSTDYVGKIATAKSEAISTVVGTDDDLSTANTVHGAKAYTDEKVAELQGNALTGVTLNDVPAQVENNVAVFDISAIVCGGAE